MDEKFLEQYKEIYLREKMSGPALKKSWDDIWLTLPVQDLPVHNQFFRYKFLFAGIILLMLIGTAGMVQASRSGELLYPVKILTNNVAAKIFGNPQITVKREEKNVKENIEDQKDLKQKGNENKEQDKTERNKSEDTNKQENEVKGVSSEVTEIKKPENEDDGKANNKNKSNESQNGNSSREKNK